MKKENKIYLITILVACIITSIVSSIFIKWPEKRLVESCTDEQQLVVTTNGYICIYKLLY